MEKGNDPLFSNQSKPILAKDVNLHISSRGATKSLDFKSEMELTYFIPITDRSQVTIVSEKQKVNVKVTNFRLGQHSFPPPIRSINVPSLGKHVKLLTDPPISKPSLPDYLDLQPIPSELPNELRGPQFTKSHLSKLDEMGNQATTVFSPDDRRVINDTSFPWSTIGRVDTPIGHGTGVMVGPRHLLTCCHVIAWNPDGTSGWVQFRPAYFAPSAPAGEAWGSTTYFKVKVDPPSIDSNEEQFDYAVVVLNKNIGDLTGWMGARSYTDAWDGQPAWTHVGYPEDLTAGNRPIYTANISLDGDNSQDDAHEIMRHKGDVDIGQSGGPFFGWWDEDKLPYVVAVQSWQNSNYNGASGGADLVDLVTQARTEFP
jgi:V8-like Glu-specific endopeptidase